MATPEFATHATASGRFPRLATAVLGRAVSLWSAWRDHRAVASMLYLDERILRDIGVTEGDIRAVLAVTPARHDPSRRLAAIVAERRADAASAAGVPRQGEARPL
jgi:uncharacterized protein YjiS (DUF1127 family)